jgi:hypothetical protein
VLLSSQSNIFFSYKAEIDKELKSFKTLIDDKDRGIIGHQPHHHHTLLLLKRLSAVPSDADLLAARSRSHTQQQIVRSREGAGFVDARLVKRTLIIADVREFRGALPPTLLLRGTRLRPVTLAVGDFVLSPEMCVERKSVADLFGSFASGRLCVLLCSRRFILQFKNVTPDAVHQVHTG